MTSPDNDGAESSLWSATAGPLPDHPPLVGDATCDVAIVGAGFTGLSAALHLAETGTDVIVLEAQTAGWGASGRNGGQVIAGLKEDPDRIEQTFGEEAGSRLVTAVGAAPGRVFDLIARHGINCDADRGGWLQPAANPAGLEITRIRAAQWQARGVAAENLSAREMADRLGTDAYRGGFFDPRCGTVHPLKYARGLASAAANQGARLHGGTPVLDLIAEQDGYRLRCPGGTVRARRVILATNGYSGPLHDGVRRSVVPVISTIVASAPLSDNVRASILPGAAAASDTRRLLNYYRLSPDGRLLMGGRGGPSARAQQRSADRLIEVARTLFPQVGDASWDYAWGGQVAVTADHYPRLHELTPGLFAGFGYNGRGVAMATVMGEALANLAAAKPVGDLAALLSPVRPLRFHRFNQQGVTAMAAWYRFRDRRDG